LTRHEWQATQERAAIAVAYAREHQLILWLAYSTIWGGLARAKQGQAADGIEEIRRGMAVLQAAGCWLCWNTYLGMLAEAHYEAGQLEQALSLLDEALAIHWSGEFYTAEMHRLKGEVLLKQGVPAGDAEQQFHKSIEVARDQNAKWWELRSTVSLCRLWQRQGKAAEAKQALAAIYNWFTEGFDTPDLKDAQALLEELS
jgi:predicted ATPase